MTSNSNCAVSYLIIVATFCTLLIAQTVSAEEAEHPSHQEHEFHRNIVALFLGVSTHDRRKDGTAITKPLNQIVSRTQNR